MSPDKEALFAEIFRVLQPGGVFVGQRLADRRMTAQPSPAMTRLRRRRGPVVQHGLARRAIAQAMQARRLRRHRADRPQSLVSRAGARSELARLQGPLYAEAAAAVGAAYVDKNIRTWQAMQKVLDSGEHRPTHLRGTQAGR